METMEWIRDASPRPRARMAGAVYLAYFLTAILAQILIGRKLVSYGTATNLVATGCYLVLTLLFYLMFKPVNRSLSLIAALFSLAGCVVMTLGFIDLTPPSISPLLFFGPYCLLIGYLIVRSIFLPRVLGMLMALAGLGWLAFLIPALPHFLSLSIEGFGIVAEASLMLWLMARGVSAERWKLQADAASQRFTGSRVSRHAVSSIAPDQGGRG